MLEKRYDKNGLQFLRNVCFLIYSKREKKDFYMTLLFYNFEVKYLIILKLQH